MLYGVSCVTREWCMAAGYYAPRSGGALAFTEVLDGQALVNSAGKADPR